MPTRSHLILALPLVAAAVALPSLTASPASSGLQSRDLYLLKAVADVRISPDGTRIAYGVRHSDRPGRPYTQLFVRAVGNGQAVRLGADASTPRWSPDGRWIAYLGRTESSSGLMVARPDGSRASLLAPVSGTNHPLPSMGESLSWSPDAKQIAFVSSTAGPEGDPSGDPLVITRYLYKPTASEGATRLNDNRRLHIFVVDLASKQIRQLTDGPFYEHSIAWSPRGEEILFLSNREKDPDRVFNYDIFSVNARSGRVRRLTDTRSAEYAPVWSPDGSRIAYQGTRRDLTSSETTMEDTHVWIMDADGGNRRELGEVIDNRQGAPQWALDGSALYFTVQERGDVRLYRLALGGGGAEAVLPSPEAHGAVGSWSLAGSGALAYAFDSPSSPAELYLHTASGTRALTSLNQDLLASRTLARVEPFTFKSFDSTPIEAFLTLPPERSGWHPLIVMIHGGPHAQQGQAFSAKAQVYAAQGWASLMVNYRGSTGYGQKLADAIFGDQNGGEAKDVLAGVDAALARYPWLDPARLGIEGGSYGGQLTNWIITQTDRFKAAIPSAGISNLVSFNYMAYYHDYLAVEFGAYPHEKGLMDRLWERSPLRYVSRVKTPTLLLHGENDNDVPIAEAEQLFIALKDVGVETVMVRYPREGHGLRETAHIVDALERSIAWYRKHLDAANGRPRADGRSSRP